MPENNSLVIDAACDLPLSYISAQHLKVLPVRLRIGNRNLLDNRDPRISAEVYEAIGRGRNVPAGTEPLSLDETVEFIASRLAPACDQALIITTSQARSKIFSTVTEAIATGRSRFSREREQAGLTRPFEVRVLDSNTLFTGHGVIAHEAARLLRTEGRPAPELIEPLQALSRHVHAYLVPEDLYFVHERARRKGDRSIGWLGYQLGSLLGINPILECYRGETSPVEKVRGYTPALRRLFDLAGHAVDKGIRTDVVVMSYAGKLGQIEKREDYREFVTFLHQRGISPLLATMSTTAAVNVGPGAFALAFAGGD